MKKHVRELSKTLNKLGIAHTISKSKNNHLKVRAFNNNFFTSATPSDNRSSLNFIKEIVRFDKNSKDIC